MQKDCVMSITDSSLHTLPISFIFIYLPMKDHVKHQRRRFLQRENVANQGLFYPLTVPISNNEMPCYLLKSRRAYAILGEYRVPNAVNLEK